MKNEDNMQNAKRWMLNAEGRRQNANHWTLYSDQHA